MGCCQSKQGIIMPFENSQTFSNLSNKQKIVLITEDLFRDFELTMNKKINPSSPKTITEYNFILSKTIKSLLHQYEELTKEYTVVKSLTPVIGYYRFYLVNKCKAFDGMFRNENDINSLNHVTALKRNLFEQLAKGIITESELLELYNKFAKGTYILEGLNNVYNLLDEVPENRIDLITRQEQAQLSILVSNKEQLVEISKTLDVPNLNVDSSTVISNLDSIHKKFELKCEDLDNNF